MEGEMDARQEGIMRRKLATRVQTALRNHKVNPETLGDTASFLAGVLGGLIGAICPEEQYDKQIEDLRESIVYGIENSVPDE
jgi:hypothetical protein